MDKKRVMAYVDGFNLYHGIEDMVRSCAVRGGRRPEHLKWVNLWSLIRAFTKPADETLVKVYYFSAYATWKPDAFRRHVAYVKALESVGVTVVLGRFKEKSRFCTNCRTEFKSHEEKETDVNLALTLQHDAMTHSFDKAIIVTGDADLKPAVQRVRQMDPGLVIHSLLPKNRLRASQDFRSVCQMSQQFGARHLEMSLFPETIQTRDGKTIVRPAKYAPPC
jgi:uncharacterized LabA/DUF88 family protein